MSLPSRLGLVCLASAAALVWAFGLIVLQPLSEPSGLDATGENNTYWARELRWGALLAGVLVLIVLVGGARRATRAVVAGGCAWLAADVALDRVDLDTEAGPFVAGAVGAAFVCCALVIAVAGRPRPAGLRVVALVAAVASGLATSTESPTDTEAALGTGSAVVGSLLALVAVVAAGHAGGPVSRPRAIAAGALAVAVPWILRLLSPQPTAGRAFGTIAFTVLLVAAVVALTRPRFLVPAVVAAVTLAMAFLPLVLLSVVLQIGKPFTMLAANPAVDAADTDIVVVVLAVPIGFVLDRVLRAFPVPMTPECEPAR